MNALMRLRSLLSIAGLTAIWCGLWGDVAPGTVAAGVVIATGVASLRLGTDGVGRVRWLPLTRLVFAVAADLARSTVNVAVEIATPTDSTDETIIAVPVPQASRDHLLILTIAITLTPGTAVVETDPDRSILYLHLLHDHRREETVQHVEQLAELACQALPVHEERSP